MVPRNLPTGLGIAATSFEKRRLEIITFDDGTRFDIWKVTAGVASIQPWSFEPEEVVVSVEIHTLTQLSYEDDSQLDKALADCKTKSREFAMKKAS